MSLASSSIKLPEGQNISKRSRHANAFPVMIHPNLGSSSRCYSQDSIIISSNTAIDEVLDGAVPQLVSRTAIVVAIPQLHGRSLCVNDLSEPRAVNNNSTDVRRAPTEENLPLPHGTAPAAEEIDIGRCDTPPREVVVDGVICRGQEQLRTSWEQIPVLVDASVAVGTKPSGRVWQGSFDAE